MKTLYFYEYELKRDELFGEFYLHQEKDKEVILTLLCDKTKKTVKKFNVVEHFYKEGEFMDDVNVTENYKDLDINSYKERLFKVTQNSDFTRNFCNY